MTFCWTRRLAAALLLLPFLATAQDAGKEEEDLQWALAESGASGVDLMRALENYLAKYPKTARRDEIEHAIAKAALEAGDQRRLIQYGERVLARDPDDLQILERVTRALLSADGKEAATRALAYAKRYEEGVRKIAKQPPPTAFGPARWSEEVDRGLGRAFVLEARATGNLGQLEPAIALARKSFETYPTAEAAREIARWLARNNQNEEAVRRYADAFTIPDSRTRDSDRAADRARMAEIWRKLKDSETGLGDVILEAYDRNVALLAARRLKLNQLDPNAQAARPIDFTLTSIGGEKLALSSLKGKVIVLDFWATWCGPCRVQHPLLEKIKKSFADRSDVVFLSVNTDEERTPVPEFLRENNWDAASVYYDEGLAGVLKLDSIPITMVLDRKGEIASRMNFIPERFVEMLTTRIQEALKAE